MKQNLGNSPVAALVERRGSETRLENDSGHRSSPLPKNAFGGVANQLLLLCVMVVGLTAGCGHKKNAGTENAASLDELNRALSVVAMRSGYLPPPTNELAKFLALTGKTMPVPPPGKKLVMDPVQRQFVLVDE